MFESSSVLPFATSQDGSVTECCDHAGAVRLKTLIEGHWRGLGHDNVVCTVERREFASAMRAAYFVVRSNLVNGLPPSANEATQ